MLPEFQLESCSELLTCVWIVCETETLRSASLGIVNKTKTFNLSSAAKDIGDLLLRETCKQSMSELCGYPHEQGTTGLPYGILPTKTTREGGLVDIASS